MLKLFVFSSFLFLLSCVYAQSEFGGPTVGLLTRAYCACECCKGQNETCFKHPSLESGAPEVDCSLYDCNEEFCTVLKREECKIGCFCSKCKDQLPKSEERRCLLRQDGRIPRGCNCGDFTEDEMNCTKIRKSESAPTSEEIDAAKENKEQWNLEELEAQLHEYKIQAKCIVPCFCQKCRDTLPKAATKKCESVKEPADNCICDIKECPTKEQYEQYESRKLKVQEAKYRALAIFPDDDKAASEAFNKEMEKSIEDGKISPMTPHGIHLSKCQLQCICNKCKEDGHEAHLEPCKKYLPKKVSGCSACDKDVTCFGGAKGSESCTIACMCKQCVNHKDMTPGLRTACGTVTKEISKMNCDCNKDPIDCNVLGQLRKMVSPEGGDLKLKSSLESSGEAHKVPTKGKLKQKHKLWDEL